RRYMRGSAGARVRARRLLAGAREFLAEEGFSECGKNGPDRQSPALRRAQGLLPRKPQTVGLRKISGFFPARSPAPEFADNRPARTLSLDSSLRTPRRFPPQVDRERAPLPARTQPFVGPSRNRVQSQPAT